MYYNDGSHKLLERFRKYAASFNKRMNTEFITFERYIFKFYKPGKGHKD